MAFFDQKHGLTRLEKCNFLDFEKFSLLMPKKISFFPAKSESIISYDGPGGSQSNIGFWQSSYGFTQSSYGFTQSSFSFYTVQFYFLHSPVLIFTQDSPVLFFLHSPVLIFTQSSFIFLHSPVLIFTQHSPVLFFYTVQL